MAELHDFSGMDPLQTMENSTPFMLLFSNYCLWFGCLGVFTYSLFTDKFWWLGLILLAPLATIKGISILWHRVARNVTYRLPSTRDIIGRPAVVLMTVTRAGGMVKIPWEGPLGTRKIPAKSLYELSKFPPGTQVFICDKERAIIRAGGEKSSGYYLVDTHLRSIRQTPQ